VRVQLRGAAAAASLVAAAVTSADARADVVQVDTTHTVWHESPTRTSMTVYNPAVDAAGTPAEWITVRGGYEADVVSGASVAVKAGAAYQAANAGADVVTTASVRDVRHVTRAGVTLRKESTQLTTGYAYSTENDYRSHTVSVAARTDVYDHNTQFELAYARNLDRVCDRAQAAGDPAVRARALEDAAGCFSGGASPLRTSRGLDTDGLQASWAQAWTPVFATQLSFTAQLVNGFQSNPYRSVVVGQGLRAQEHVPAHRARESVTLRANGYLRPLKAAVRATVRGYVDTWDVRSVTAELELEKYLGERLRASLRGRFYRQGGALFWSDDYTGGDPPLGPKGQYWTGDREHSPFTSVLAGVRATYAWSGQGEASFVRALKVVGYFDLVSFAYDEYTLGGVRVDGARGFLFGGSLTASF